MASDAGDRYTPEEWDVYCAVQEAEEAVIKANATCANCKYHATVYDHHGVHTNAVCLYSILADGEYDARSLYEDSTPETEECDSWEHK